MTDALTFPSDGVDYSFSRPNIATLKAGGNDWVGRYVTGAGGKALTPGEARAIHNEGMHIALIFEGEAEGALRGSGQGVTDAEAAAAACHALEVPEWIVTYFAIDYEMTDERRSATRAYLAAARKVMAVKGYHAGSYGGFGTVAVAAAAGIAYFFQTLAWSDGRWDERATIEQYQVNVKAAGGEVDRCRALRMFGGWAP